MHVHVALRVSCLGRWRHWVYTRGREEMLRERVKEGGGKQTSDSERERARERERESEGEREKHIERKRERERERPGGHA